MRACKAKCCWLGKVKGKQKKVEMVEQKNVEDSAYLAANERMVTKVQLLMPADDALVCSMGGGGEE